MPMMMPDSLSTATLFPLAAIRVSRPAEPLIWVDMEEKVSVCNTASVSTLFCYIATVGSSGSGTYRRVDHVLGSRIVININRHAAQCRHLGRKLI